MGLPVPDGAVMLTKWEKSFLSAHHEKLKEFEKRAAEEMQNIRDLLLVIGDRGTGRNGGMYELSADFNFLIVKE